MARIQKHAWLAFKVEGRKLEAKNTNPILHQFYNLLNDFRIKKNGTKIVVTSKDTAIIEQIDSMWLKGSIHLDMEIINFRGKEENIIGLDHPTEALILRELEKLRVDEGAYSQHVTISVLEATFSENYRRNPDAWPTEPLFRTQI